MPAPAAPAPGAFDLPLASWRDAIRRRLGPRGGWKVGSVSLAVGGWSLTWAEAVGLFDLAPLWLPAAAFFAGLALIPVARFGAGDEPQRR